MSFLVPSFLHIATRVGARDARNARRAREARACRASGRAGVRARGPALAGCLVACSAFLTASAFAQPATTNTVPSVARDAPSLRAPVPPSVESTLTLAEAQRIALARSQRLPAQDAAALAAREMA